MLQKQEIKTFFSTRNSAILGLAMVMILISFYWIISPHTKRIDAAERLLLVKGELEKKHEVLKANVAVQRKRLETLRKAFEENNDSAKLFRTSEAKEFFSDVQAMAEEAGCVVESIRFAGDGEQTQERTKSDGNIYCRQASLSVTGTYNQLLRLVNRLQERLRRVWIHSLDIATIQGSSEQVRCQMVLAICVVNSNEEGLENLPESFQ